MTLERLKREAGKAARWRQHLLRWEVLSDTLVRGTCKLCEQWVDANSRPMPNEIDIGGPAVALDCEKRLFIGVFPEGLVYADRGREKNGDYVRLAFLSYRTLELTWEPNTLKHPCRNLILHSAQAMVAKKGEFFSTSISGQGVILGG
jgi:hypothetical protein